MKRFVSAENIRNNSFKIARLLLQNEFVPTIIYAVLRGGVYVANPIHEYYMYKGYDIKYGTIRATSYRGSEKLKEVSIEYIAPGLETIKKEDRILLAEDIIDTRRTLAKIIQEIEAKTLLKRELDKTINSRRIVVACNDYKERDADEWHDSKTNPDYYANKWGKDDWIHYTTHELMDLKEEEIEKIYGGIEWK